MESFSYSIIIPHKNIPELLVRCVDSIPFRSDVQVVIVDDNSVGAEEYRNRYPELNKSNVELILTKEGKGAGYARNVGLSHADGRWILFVDADDVVSGNILECLDRYYNSECNFILFKTQCRMSDNLSEYGYRQYMCDNWNKGIDRVLQHEGDKYEVLSDCDVPWGKMVRKSFLFLHDIRFEETMVSNDVVWSTRVLVNLKETEIAFSKDVIYTLTERQGSLCKQQDIKAYCCRFGVFHRKYELMRKTGFGDYSSFNYPVWFLRAQSMGTKAFVTFTLYVCKNVKNIPPVYNVERALHFSRPYFYFLVLTLQTLKRNAKA